MIWQYVYRIWERSAEEERLKQEAEKQSAEEEVTRLKEEELKKGGLINRVASGAGSQLMRSAKGVLSVIPGVGGKPMDPDERVTQPCLCWLCSPCCHARRFCLRC